LPEVIEFIDSRSIQTSGGRGTGSRVFHAAGYSNASDVFALLGTTVSGVAVPRAGESHPEFPGLVARDFSIEKVSGHSDLWKLTWQYEVVSRGFPDYPEIVVPEVLPNEVDYVEISSEIRNEFYNAWRLKPTLPADGIVLDPTLDIQGTPVDAAGNPTSIQRRIQELTITETVNEPRYGVYSAFQFTRNSTTFLGAAVGSVVYNGVSIRRTGLNVYQVSHRFTQDSEYHLQQTPLIEFPDGTPKLDANGKHAAQVYFIQPFDRLADLNTISFNF